MPRSAVAGFRLYVPDGHWLDQIPALLLSLYDPLGEFGCFLAEVLDRLLRIFVFRGIHAYQTYSLPILQHNGVSINYPSDSSILGFSLRSCLR
jgi:hypothetical protein